MPRDKIKGLHNEISTCVVENTNLLLLSLCGILECMGKWKCSLIPLTIFIEKL